ncbi:MAG TPA: hypothetical protein VK306_00130 [Acidimicrobiales bacterium]|nr:hypothetical protein [Acidimicrobiales bacterium]
MAAVILVCVVVAVRVFVGVVVRRIAPAAPPPTIRPAPPSVSPSPLHLRRPIPRPARPEGWVPIPPGPVVPRRVSGRHRGGTPGSLSALSAVERRGQLARLIAVTFVEGSAAVSAPLVDAVAPAPGASDAGVVAPDADADPVLAAEGAQPEGVPPCRLRAACQIVHVERVGPGTMIDLVTLGDGRMGTTAVPAGSPLALGFGSEPAGGDCHDLRAVMGYWEAIGVVLLVEVAETAHGARYRFSSPDDGLAVLVETDRP